MSHLNVNSLYWEPWHQFKKPIVRQLAFSIASPNIVLSLPPDLNIKYEFQLHDSDFWHQQYQNYEARLFELDQDSRALDQFVAQLKSTRLGLRFEMLFWFWLLDDAYHDYQLIQHSIQVIDGAKTIGELDFLLLNKKTQQIEHWEVALKYYLAEKDLHLIHWYGLNRSDTLLRKLKHFTEKQFQFKHACEQAIDQRFAVMKGQLYLPLLKENQYLPTWVNAQRRTGTWGSHIPNQFKNYYRLQRHEWICPHNQPSSAMPIWWTDGLYFNPKLQHFYMYRQSPLLQLNDGNKKLFT